MFVVLSVVGFVCLCFCLSFGCLCVAFRGRCTSQFQESVSGSGSSLLLASDELPD